MYTPENNLVDLSVFFIGFSIIVFKMNFAREFQLSFIVFESAS